MIAICKTNAKLDQKKGAKKAPFFSVPLIVNLFYGEP